MNFISLCSGIEAASVAFGPLGWKAIAFSEIEGFPSAVLAHHYPTVRNYGDMSLFRDWPDELFADADAIVGGPPCQAFSVAGARRGLLDARGNLTLIYVELLDHADDIRRKYGKPPVVALYENVPGIFSDRTNAFGCLVGGLAGEDVPVVPPGKRWTDAGCVFGPERAVAWRVLDAQYFALAQRRRRVFVVASARKGFDPAQVLFEWDGVRRDTAPSREARQVAPTIPARSTAGGGLGTDFDCDGGTICVATGQAGAEIGADMAPTLNCNHEAPYVARTLLGKSNCSHAEDKETYVCFDASEDGTGRGGARRWCRSASRSTGQTRLCKRWPATTSWLSVCEPEHPATSTTAARRLFSSQCLTESAPPTPAVTGGVSKKNARTPWIARKAWRWHSKCAAELTGHLWRLAATWPMR